MKRVAKWTDKIRKKNIFFLLNRGLEPLPFTGSKARIVPVEPPRLDSKLLGLIAGYIPSLPYIMVLVPAREKQ